jgi:hypothetical protein
MMELPLSGETPTHVYYLNGKRVEGRSHHVTVGLARTSLSPECAGYMIWRESDYGGRDHWANDSDTIPIGARFYSIPYAHC